MNLDPKEIIEKVGDFIEEKTGFDTDPLEAKAEELLDNFMHRNDSEESSDESEDDSSEDESEDEESDEEETEEEEEDEDDEK